MGAIPHDSAFWYSGRLTPAADASRFHVEEFPLFGRACRLEVFREGLAVWSKANSPVMRSREEIERFVRVLLGAYALYSGTVLDFHGVGTVEATHADFAGTIVGFVVAGGRDTSVASRRTRPSVDLARAASLSQRLLGTPWVYPVADLREALRFVHSSTPSESPAIDDSFVSGYRAIEGARTAASLDAARPERTWLALQALLNESEQALKARTADLKKVRDAVMHRHDSDGVLPIARANPAPLLGIPRDLIADALEAKGMIIRSEIRALARPDAEGHPLPRSVRPR